MPFLYINSFPVFSGGEFEYSRMYVTYLGDIYVEGEMNSMWNSEVLHKTYSIIPYMGIRFSYKHWETEMKYELFLSKIKFKERGFYQKENLSWGTGLMPPRIYEINGVLSFNLTYYF